MTKKRGRKRLPKKMTITDMKSKSKDHFFRGLRTVWKGYRHKTYASGKKHFIEAVSPKGYSAWYEYKNGYTLYMAKSKLPFELRKRLVSRKRGF